ncbi:hypothetical protein C6W24_03970 [Bacillus atrophaeus]|uniref:hypothetical protein n=1 Tax=Bacillus atrophaeus TaxID=1452 RepID=UPI000D034DF3|nr:hypothetical protein [Bacillus atrophaeus]PRS03109.1 hypothetical protein C6W24_03970 [Bacillus atrophaeus]
MTENFFESQYEIFDAISNIGKFKAPVIDIPNITLPNFDFPDFDYGHLEKCTTKLSSYGWTLSGEMPINYYLSEHLLDLRPYNIDQYFVNLFEENNKELFNSIKKAILETIEPKWGELMEMCFSLYGSDSFTVIIPVLITTIEGEISAILGSFSYGKPLIGEMKKSIKEERFLQIVSYSLCKYLEKSLFKTHHFSNQRRLTNINRNWVLHGRDDPRQWTKVDALKLLNVISTLQFIKSCLKEGENI